MACRGCGAVAGERDLCSPAERRRFDRAYGRRPTGTWPVVRGPGREASAWTSTPTRRSWRAMITQARAACRGAACGSGRICSGPSAPRLHEFPRPGAEIPLPEWSHTLDIVTIWSSDLAKKRRPAIRTVEVLESARCRQQPPWHAVGGPGLTRSRYFMRFLAAAAERQIVIPANDELTAFGAAMLAATTPCPSTKPQRRQSRGDNRRHGRIAGTLLACAVKGIRLAPEVSVKPSGTGG